MWMRRTVLASALSIMRLNTETREYWRCSWSMARMWMLRPSMACVLSTVRLCTDTRVLWSLSSTARLSALEEHLAS